MGYLRNLLNAVTGKPMAVIPTSGYNAATNGRRLLSVGSSTRGVSSLALADGPSLMARARKAVMDNPLASIGVTSFIAETIGTGMRPHSRHRNPDVRRLLEQEFSLWAPQSSATRRIGTGGKPDSLQNFFTQQTLICRNVVEAGEAFVRLRPRYAADLSATGLRVPLQLDLIERAVIMWSNPGDVMGSPDNLIRGGIEFNPIHERIAYHFYREHPGDAAIWPNTYEVTRVPAAEILHVMEFTRGNQIRGITPLAPILIALADLDNYDDAERLRQKLGAYLFAWKKTLTPDDPNLVTTTTTGSDSAPEGTAYVESQPGAVTIIDTNAGEDIGFYNHPGVADGYDVFMKNQNRKLAAAMRITYEMLTGDMTQVNYSSARVRLIALRRIWRQFQQSVIEHQVCRPVWRAWLDAAALAGIIDSADYLRNPEEYLNVEWLPQPWEWIDPQADAQTVRMKIESALTSRSREIAKLGRDAEQVDSEIATDHERERQLGIQPVYGSFRPEASVTSEHSPAKQGVHE